MSEEDLEEKQKWIFKDAAFSIWNASFSKADRVEMIHDDLHTGRSLSLFLATLVAIGLVLSILTVVFVSSWR